MSTINTPAMPVASFSTASPGRITFRMAQPFLDPLFVGQLTFVRNTTITGISGRVPPGTPTHPEVATLQVAAAKYDEILSFINSHTALAIVLSYDPLTFSVSDVLVSSSQPQPSANSVNTLSAAIS